jgi:Fis family transcriptional regulator, factor for inversion stimulation protein
MRRGEQSKAFMSNTLAHPPSLQECIASNLNYYIQTCQGQQISGVYDMVLAAIEKPMLEVVMRHCEDNQSAAAAFLGLNRNTLRKKLITHKLLGE